MEKERRTKALLLSTLVVVVATLSIAFASLSRTLNINGIGKMDTATWDVRFENLREAKIVRDAIEVDEPKITDKGGVVENINVKLTKPKDEISYTVDIVNRGTIDAQVNIMTISDLTDEEKKLIDFGVYYLNGAKITKYDLLEPEDVKSIIIKIRYKDDITEHDLPKEPIKIKLSCQIEYVQSDAEVVIKPNGEFESDKNGGYIFDGVESVLSVDSRRVFNGKIPKNKVESITFVGTLKVPQEAKDTAWDASYNKDGSVVAWYTDLDNNGLYELNLGGNKKIYAPSNSSKLFSYLSNLKKINFNDVFDTSNVTDASYMFARCSSLTSIDLSSFNTSKVATMNDMFSYCTSLTSINLSSFDTSNVTDASYMFNRCSSLTKIDLSSFDTSNVIDMSGMFDNCSSLTSIDLSSFNTSNVTDVSYMFFNCTSLKNIDLSMLDTKNVTEMSSMFEECIMLEKVNMNTLNLTNLKYSYDMFLDTSLKVINLNNIVAPSKPEILSEFTVANEVNMKNVNAENLTSFMHIFSNDKIVSLHIKNWNISNITDISFMFSDCTSLKNIDLSDFDTSNVTNMERMFDDCTSLKNIDLSSLNTSNVTNMYGLFSGCSSLTSINLSSFNTSNVIDMDDMFYNCSSLASLDLSHFNTSNVTDMNSMFSRCTLLKRINLSSFDTSKVTGMIGMFYGCSSLISLDLRHFNTEKVNSMGGMFSGCTSLISVNLDGWDTSRVTHMQEMFYNCTSLTSIDLSFFNTESIESIDKMFYNCTSLTFIDFSNAVSTNFPPTRAKEMFTNVPNGFKIYVRNNNERIFILGLRSDANVIIGSPSA